MVADELAVRLASAHVRPGMRVLDPFCGTGRLLFAAARTASTHCIGLDINPLACLLAEAKAAKPSTAKLRELRQEAAAKPRKGCVPLTLRGAKVDWLSDQVAAELGEIIAWLNRAELSRDELLVTAACLSAATREAAWIRKSGWKLHRMHAAARAEHRVSAWSSFTTKLDHYLREASLIPLAGTVATHNVDAAAVRDISGDLGFDLVMTSPPYGDSRTTVQYGAASGICLDVVSRLEGLDNMFMVGSAIDRACLGGARARVEAGFRLRDYWAGSAHGEPARRAKAFLHDYMEVLEKCNEVLSPGGSMVVIVGRRSLGGYRLRLDDFTREVLIGLGCALQGSMKRHFQQKSIPRKINRFGRAGDADRRLAGSTKTMDGEIILTLTKKAQVERLAA
jgi:DNA modification methylase